MVWLWSVQGVGFDLRVREDEGDGRPFLPRRPVQHLVFRLEVCIGLAFDFVWVWLLIFWGFSSEFAD